MALIWGIKTRNYVVAIFLWLPVVRNNSDLVISANLKCWRFSVRPEIYNSLTASMLILLDNPECKRTNKCESREN